MAELLARMRAVVRRKGGVVGPVLSNESLESNAVKFLIRAIRKEAGQQRYRERQGYAMDGFQGESRQSMQFRPSVWLSLAILGIALAAGAFSFFAAFDEVNELQDEQLNRIASLVNRQVLPAAHAGFSAHHCETDVEARFVVQTLPHFGSAMGTPTNGASSFLQICRMPADSLDRE